MFKIMPDRSALPSANLGVPCGSIPVPRTVWPNLGWPNPRLGKSITQLPKTNPAVHRAGARREQEPIVSAIASIVYMGIKCQDSF